MRELMTKDGKSPEDIYKPELPLEVAKWIESNEISSANLRNGLWQKAPIGDQNNKKSPVKSDCPHFVPNNHQTNNYNNITGDKVMNVLPKTPVVIDGLDQKSFV